MLLFDKRWQMRWWGLLWVHGYGRIRWMVGQGCRDKQKAPCSLCSSVQDTTRTIYRNCWASTSDLSKWNVTSFAGSFVAKRLSCWPSFRICLRVTGKRLCRSSFPGLTPTIRLFASSTLLKVSMFKDVIITSSLGRRFCPCCWQSSTINFGLFAFRPITRISGPLHTLLMWALIIQL